MINYSEWGHISRTWGNVIDNGVEDEIQLHINFELFKAKAKAYFGALSDKQISEYDHP